MAEFTVGFNLLYYFYFSDLEVICKFAQMEFSLGEIERGRTIFENALSSYPKRTDVWSIYIDTLIKAKRLEDTR